MSVVIRAKDSLTSLEVDDSLDKWTEADMEKLSLLKCLKYISFTFDGNQHPGGISKIAQLDQLEVLKIDFKINALGYGFSLMKNVFEQLKQLKIVELTNANGQMLFALASNNPGLKALKVQTGCSYSFDDETIYALSNNCPDLEELELSFCYLRKHELVPVKFSFPKMKHLDIRFYTYNTYEASAVEKTVMWIIENLKCLRSFKLRGFYNGSGKVVIKDSLFQRIRSQYPEIDFTY